MTKSVEMMDDVIRSATDSDQNFVVLINSAIKAVAMSDQGFLTRDPNFKILDRDAYILCTSVCKVCENIAIDTPLIDPPLIDPRIQSYILVHEYENGGRKREMEKNMIQNMLKNMLDYRQKDMQNDMQNKIFLQRLFGTKLPWEG